MVGHLLTLTNGVRTLYVEAGWPRTPRDGFVRGGGLACASIRHLGIRAANQELLLIKVHTMVRRPGNRREQTRPSRIRHASPSQDSPRSTQTTLILNRSGHGGRPYSTDFNACYARHRLCRTYCRGGTPWPPSVCPHNVFRHALHLFALDQNHFQNRRDSSTGTTVAKAATTPKDLPRRYTRKMTNRHTLKFSLFAAAILALCLPVAASAQWGGRYPQDRYPDNRGNGRYDDRGLRDSVHRLDRLAKDFERDMDRALDRSRANGSRREDEYQRPGPPVSRCCR